MTRLGYGNAAAINNTNNNKQLRGARGEKILAAPPPPPIVPPALLFAPPSPSRLTRRISTDGTLRGGSGEASGTIQTFVFSILRDGKNGVRSRLNLTLWPRWCKRDYFVREKSTPTGIDAGTESTTEFTSSVF